MSKDKKRKAAIKKRGEWNSSATRTFSISASGLSESLLDKIKEENPQAAKVIPPKTPSVRASKSQSIDLTPPPPPKIKPKKD